MNRNSAIAVMGTFDTKGTEHHFLADRVRARGLAALTINIGTRRPPARAVDIDLYRALTSGADNAAADRDRSIAAMIRLGQDCVRGLHERGALAGILSAGGGTGTHLCSRIMQVLPLAIPKVMISTVAARDMSSVVGTSDIAMLHSVTDILGVNSVTGRILDRGAGAVCAMAQSDWTAPRSRQRVALSFFGFITPAAERIKALLEQRGYEVVPFHANGIGGMAMVKLAADGYFDAILDLATHELADAMFDGYCGNIGPERFAPIPGRPLPRLVVPGGMDCAVLEFTRDQVPERYRARKIFFYDFRSAIRLKRGESLRLAKALAADLNTDAANVSVLVPQEGFSAADRRGAPLYDPQTGQALIDALKAALDPSIPMEIAALHINDPAFADLAVDRLERMLRRTESG